jgi:hypothetical protein
VKFNSIEKSEKSTFKCSISLLRKAERKIMPNDFVNRSINISTPNYDKRNLLNYIGNKFATHAKTAKKEKRRKPSYLIAAGE